jgi:hypothetical protein
VNAGHAQAFRLYPGVLAEVTPAYNSETGCRDIWDEVAGCQAEVLRSPASNGDTLVWINGLGETWIYFSRLRTKEAS